MNKKSKLALAWYYRFHSFYVEPCEDLEYAVEFLSQGEDYGSLSIDSIEAWDTDGQYRRFSREECYQMMEASRKPYTPPPAPALLISLYVDSPDDAEKVLLNTFTDDQKAEAAISRYRPLLGGRLTVESLTIMPNTASGPISAVHD